MYLINRESGKAVLFQLQERGLGGYTLLLNKNNCIRTTSLDGRPKWRISKLFSSNGEWSIPIISKQHN